MTTKLDDSRGRTDGQQDRGKETYFTGLRFPLMTMAIGHAMAFISLSLCAFSFLYFTYVRFLMFSLYSSFADEVPCRFRDAEERKEAGNILRESIACLLLMQIQSGAFLATENLDGPCRDAPRGPVAPSARKWFLHSATNCLNDEPVASVGKPSARRANGFSQIELATQPGWKMSLWIRWIG